MIKLVCIGKIKDPHLSALITDYEKKNLKKDGNDEDSIEMLFDICCYVNRGIRSDVCL